MQKLKNNEARPKFTGSYKKACTYRKLDTTITHLQYLDLKIIFLFFVRLLLLPHINNKLVFQYGQIKSAPVPRAPVIVSALI